MQGLCRHLSDPTQQMFCRHLTLFCFGNPDIAGAVQPFGCIKHRVRIGLLVCAICAAKYSCGCPLIYFCPVKGSVYMVGATLPLGIMYTFA